MDIWIVITYIEDRWWVVGAANSKKLAEEIGEAAVLNDEIPGFDKDDPHYAEYYTIHKLRLATQ